MPRTTETRGRTVRIAVIALAAALMSVSPAAAAVRYASPTSLDTVGTCGSTAPCRIDHAVGGASAGDEVVVLPGDYTLTSTVSASVDVDIHAKPGEAMPRLIGVSGIADPTLEMTDGGTVSGLYLETTGGTALHLSRGARGDGLVVVADTTAPAVQIESSTPSTALVNSVVQATGTASAVDVTDGSGPAGGAALVNVTAVATGTAPAITTETREESAVVRNVIARGTSTDLEGVPGSLGIDVAYSNFRPAASGNWNDGGHNQTEAPSFANELTGNYRQAAGSPTIDAGTPHPLVDGTVDPDGRARSLGAAPDIGAFEFDSGGAGGGSGGDGGGGSGGGDGDGGSGGSDGGLIDRGLLDPILGDSNSTPGLSPPAVPEAGTSVVVQGSRGTPLVQLPGSDEFVPLTGGATIPVGSTIDARRSEVSLTSVRDADGQLQTGTFWGGVFKVRQTGGPRPITELVLTGGDFSRCDGSRTAGKAVHTARARHRARVRRLWGRDRGGRFRTRGRRSQATVRGTVWLVEDRCDGTLTRVKQGAVVVRDFGRRRNVLVRKGRSYLARAR